MPRLEDQAGIPDRILGAGAAGHAHGAWRLQPHDAEEVEARSAQADQGTKPPDTSSCRAAIYLASGSDIPDGCCVGAGLISCAVRICEVAVCVLGGVPGMLPPGAGVRLLVRAGAGYGGLVSAAMAVSVARRRRSCLGDHPTSWRPASGPPLKP